jgi:hypothetical protein
MSEIGVTMHWRGTNRKTKTSIIRIVNMREALHWWWWLLVCWRNNIRIRPRLLVAANHALGVILAIVATVTGTATAVEATAMVLAIAAVEAIAIAVVLIIAAVEANIVVRVTAIAIPIVVLALMADKAIHAVLEIAADARLRLGFRSSSEDSSELASELASEEEDESDS